MGILGGPSVTSFFSSRCRLPRMAGSLRPVFCEISASVMAVASRPISHDCQSGFLFIRWWILLSEFFRRFGGWFRRRGVGSRSDEAQLLGQRAMKSCVEVQQGRFRRRATAYHSHAVIDVSPEGD